MGARLPYRAIVALLRASHQTRTETRTETKAKEFSAGRALLSGGLMLRKSVTREERSVATEREQVLYLFGPNGSTPWILRERGTHYAGLGAAAGPSSTQYFLATLAELRKRAPRAVYDERLMQARKAPTRSVRTAGTGAESVAVSSIDGVDLLAHLLALSLQHAALSPRAAQTDSPSAHFFRRAIPQGDAFSRCPSPPPSPHGGHSRPRARDLARRRRPHLPAVLFGDDRRARARSAPCRGVFAASR